MNAVNHRESALDSVSIQLSVYKNEIALSSALKAISGKTS